MLCPALLWNVPPIVTFPVDDAEVKAKSLKDDEAFTVKSPVELVNVKRLLDVALPPNWPNKTCVSTPVVTPPPQPVQVVTVKAPIVELGLRNSVDDTTPIGETVKNCWPVLEEMIKRFAV
mgnify:CR=1 FL=1